MVLVQGPKAGSGGLITFNFITYEELERAIGIASETNAFERENYRLLVDGPETVVKNTEMQIDLLQRNILCLDIQLHAEKKKKPKTRTFTCLRLLGAMGLGYLLRVMR